MSKSIVGPELFKVVNADVSAYIKKKLLSMELDVTDIDLHNSASTKTFRVYVTLKRTTNLKALFLAEQVICKEIEKEFLFLPYAFYWRYKPEPVAGGPTGAEPAA